jgi:broad specificity phosphatase PhoE
MLSAIPTSTPSKSNQIVGDLKTPVRRLVVLRHSERIDEVDLPLWIQMVNEEFKRNNNRNIDDFESDPLITENGKYIASDAGQTLVTDIFSNDNFENLRFIYCSKLRRCIETAYEVSKVFASKGLNIPILVSRGLALTAAAVNRKPSTFEFCDIEDIRQFCPGVEIIDCDNEGTDYFIPSDNWLVAITHIVNRNEFSFVVAHRETVRNIAGLYQKLPYCCIANFSCENINENSINFCLQQLVDKDGNPIHIQRSDHNNGPPPSIQKKNKAIEFKSEKKHSFIPFYGN